MPRNARLQFCTPCNARERIIIGGKCSICRNDPTEGRFELQAPEITTASS